MSEQLSIGEKTFDEFAKSFGRLEALVAELQEKHPGLILTPTSESARIADVVVGLEDVALHFVTAIGAWRSDGLEFEPLWSFMTNFATRNHLVVTHGDESTGQRNYFRLEAVGHRDERRAEALMLLQEAPPSSLSHPHTHDGVELITNLTYRGKYKVFINHKEYELAAEGGTALLLPGDIHHISYEASQGPTAAGELEAAVTLVVAAGGFPLDATTATQTEVNRWSKLERYTKL